MIRLTRISTIVLLLLAPTGLLPLSPKSFFFLPEAQAQTAQDRKAEADNLLNQGSQQVRSGLYPAAIQSFEQALILYREIQARRGEATSLSLLSWAYLGLENGIKAMEFSQQAVTIAKELQDPELEKLTLQFLEAAQRLANSTTQVSPQKVEANRLLQQGIQQYQTSQFEAALNSWQQSLQIYRELKDRHGEGNALGNLGLAYDSLGNYGKAIEYQEQALAIAQELKDRHGEGQSLSNMGNAYLNLGNYGKAIEDYEQALAIAQELKDRHGEGNALGNLGVAYATLSNYGKAIEYQEQALAIAQELKDRHGEGQSLSNMGNAYLYLGNYGKAIEYQEQALAIAQELKDRHGEGNALGNLGLAYLYLGNYGKAIEYQEQALAIAQELKDRLGEGQSLNNLGIAYLSLGNYGKAIEYQEQALAIAQELKDRLGEGNALGNLGLAYYHLGNYGKAIEDYKQALAIAQELKDRLGEGQSLSNLGLAYLYLGNYGKAIEYQEQSLAIARQIKNRRGEGIALNNLGLALFESGKLGAAKETFFDGIAVLESIRQTGVSNNDANKVSIFEEQARTYRLLQEVLVAQSQSNAALEIAERGRARAFVELLAQQLANQESNIKSLNLQQIQQIAKSQNATLVQYSIIRDDFKVDGKEQTHDAALYIWVIQPDGKINFRQVDLKPLWQQQHTSLAKLVATARCFGFPTCEQTVATRSINRVGGVEVVYSPNTSDRLGSSIIHSQSNTYLQQLHQLLIEPIADLLPTDPTAHVIFMPQESLFLVPFAALVDKSNHYLIQQHTISIAPSIQVLSLTHQQQAALPKTTTPSVLVAGDPTMPKVVIPGEDAPLTLPDLPGAKQEAIAVAKTFNTTALVGNQATKHAILQQMQTARLIHLATHGLLDDFKGLGVPGAIALAPDGTGQPNDGLLTADDILNMKLNAELVVLSACDTGQGRLTGDGVIGLSRSLISAGVPSVIVSLWSIPDAPTASLMTQFYQNLQHTPDKAQALRQAMLSTMKDHPDPIDWAAFTLIGEAN